MKVTPSVRLVALVCAAAWAAGPIAAGGPSVRDLASTRARADLVVSRERLRDSINIRTRDAAAGDCTIAEGCLGGLGRRRTLEFDTYVVNAGTEALTLGNPADRPDLYEYSACHGHYHLKNSFVYAVSHGGDDTVGVYDATTGTVAYRDANVSGAPDGSVAFASAAPGALPVAGDWERAGASRAGIYDSATGRFTLSSGGSREPISIDYRPESSALLPVAGDWDGDGTDTVGVYSPTSHTFYLKRKNTKSQKTDVVVFNPGEGDWRPVAGDWDGDDVDTVGLYDRATGRFELKNANASGPSDVSFAFGTGDALPIAGDWNRDGVDTVATYDPASGEFLLRNENAAGEPDAVVSIDGGAGRLPVAGDWNYEAGDVLVPGHKEAFCWLDTQRVSGSEPPHFTDCNSSQGLTAGWCDIYIRNTDCQWIDITGLAPGVYQLTVTVNAAGGIPESDRTNNSASVKVRIPKPRREAKAPTVEVLGPAAGRDLVAGQPVTLCWRVSGGRDVTHQELWLADVSDGHPSKVMLVDGAVDRRARSYTWVPPADMTLVAAQFVVRAQNDEGFVGTDARSAGAFAIRSE